MSSNPPPPDIEVTVRWWDGYMETFSELDEVRASGELLFLAKGSLNRSIPLRGVRWYSQTPESHQPGTNGP